MNLKPLKVGLLSLCLASLMMLLSCETSVPDQTPVAYVSLYHASPDAPKLDIYLNTKKYNNGAFAYKTYSGYLPLEAKAHSFMFTEEGESDNLADVTSTFLEGSFYSMYVVNEFEALDVWLFQDIPVNTVSGHGEVRLVHVSPDTAPVYVTVDNEPNSLLGNVSYRQGPAFQEVPAGERDFFIRDSATGDIILTLENKTIEAGKFYTIIVRGFSNPPSGGNGLGVEIVLN